MAPASSYRTGCSRAHVFVELVSADAGLVELVVAAVLDNCQHCLDFSVLCCGIIIYIFFNRATNLSLFTGRLGNSFIIRLKKMGSLGRDEQGVFLSNSFSL